MIKQLMLFMLLLMVVPLASADLGTFQQGKCIDIKTVLNTTSVNITSVDYPNGTSAVTNKQMSQLTNKNFNYTFCSTVPLGQYNYGYFDAEGNTYSNYFTITPSGLVNPLGYFIIGFVIVYVIGFVGFFGKNEWVTIIGGLAMISLGLYSLLNGIDNYRTTLTDVIAWWTIALGAFFSLYAGVSVVQDNM